MGEPVIVLAPDTFPQAIVAVAMVVVEVYLLTQIVPRRGPPPPLTRMVIGTAALLGSAGLLMSITWAFLASDLSNYTVVLLMFNFAMVGPPSLWFPAVVLFRDRPADATSWFWPAAIVAMATSAELLMGLFFTVAAGSPLAPAVLLAGTLTSAWYLWSMAGAMAALLLWLPLDARLRAPLGGLTGAAIVAPWVTADPGVGALLMAAVMAATLLGSLRLLLRRPASEPRLLRVVLATAAAFAVMTAGGLAVAVAPASNAAVLAFGLAMSSVMVAEFLFLLHEGLRSRAPIPVVGTVMPTTVPVTAGRPTGLLR